MDHEHPSSLRRRISSLLLRAAELVMDTPLAGQGTGGGPTAEPLAGVERSDLDRMIIEVAAAATPAGARLAADDAQLGRRGSYSGHFTRRGAYGSAGRRRTARRARGCSALLAPRVI